jgi:hypothetical protein
MILTEEDYEQIANMVLERGDEYQYLFKYKDDEELSIDYHVETFSYQEDETGAYIYTGVDFYIRRVHSYNMESGEDTVTDLDETKLCKQIEQFADLN